MDEYRLMKIEDWCATEAAHLDLRELIILKRPINF